MKMVSSKEEENKDLPRKSLLNSLRIPKIKKRTFSGGSKSYKKKKVAQEKESLKEII